MSQIVERPWVKWPFKLGLEHLRLALLTTGRRLVVVIGAGISIDSGVPSGNELLDIARGAFSWIEEELKKKGANEFSTLEQFLDSVFSILPFDSKNTISRIMSDAGIPEVANATHVPTLGHLCVSRLVQGGTANLVISLNFDELLERCIEAELDERGKNWFCIDDEDGFSKLDDVVFEAEKQAKCVVLKPHGTISKGNLLAAATTVRAFDENLEKYLMKIFKDDSTDVVFIGCSLRDLDFSKLFGEIGKVKATITIFDKEPVDEWLKVSKNALGLEKHHFDTDKFSDTKIVYVQCNDLEEVSDNAPITETANHIYVQRKCSPAQALLEVMVGANDSTGFLQEVNAPWVSDLLIHNWIRRYLPGKRPGPEAFLTTEILVGAAHENGLFTRKRIVETRGHLRLADRDEYFSRLVDQIFEGLLASSVSGLPPLLLRKSSECFEKREDAQTEYALRRLRGEGIKDRIVEALGLSREDALIKVSELIDLFVDIAEHKAIRSAWRTSSAKDLVTLEQGTRLVTDTTNSLLVISEYGTWMRRRRFVDGVKQALGRAKNSGVPAQVILSSPPPPESQGYLEWLTSALWLKRQGVELYVFDYEKHYHHITLGDQVAIDFKREGTRPILFDSGVRLSAQDRYRLRRIFDTYKNSGGCETFDQWQFREGLAARFGQVLVHVLYRCPLEQVVLIRDRNLDKEADEKSRECTTKVSMERVKSNRPPLQDNLLFRPGGFRVESGALKIQTGVTSYFLAVGAEKKVNDWREDEITGAGLSVIPYCHGDKGKQVLVGKRTRQVYSGEGKFHLTGGHAHPSSRDFDQEKLIDACYQELEEEMRITHADIDQLEFLGLTLDLDTSKPEFIVLATLKEKAEDYIKRWELNGGSEEFESVTTAQALFATDSEGMNENGVPFSTKRFLAERNRLVNAAQSALICYVLSDAMFSIDPLEAALT